MSDSPRQSDSQSTLPGDLILYASIGVLILVLSFVLYGVGFQLFGNQVIAAVSAFGASASSVLTIFVLVIYMRQTRILRQHQRALEEQSDLMSLDHLPDITVTDVTMNGDRLELDIQNRGEGVGSQLELHTRVETPDIQSSDSSFDGITPLYRITSSGDTLEDQTIGAHNEESYVAEPTLEKEMTHGDPVICSFEEIIQSIHSDSAQWVRVELNVQPYLQNGDPARQVPALPHESTFRVDLSRIDTEREDCFTLENLHKKSIPA